MPTVVERHRSQGKIYAIDSVGKPLTPAMAQALREGALAAAHKRALPHLIARGLARQPNEPYVPPRPADDPFPLTLEGARIKKLLGQVPDYLTKPTVYAGRVIKRDYDTRYCPRCHAYVDARLIAWDLYSWTSDLGEDIVCVNCLEENA